MLRIYLKPEHFCSVWNQPMAGSVSQTICLSANFGVVHARPFYPPGRLSRRLQGMFSLQSLGEEMKKLTLAVLVAVALVHGLAAAKSSFTTKDVVNKRAAVVATVDR